MRTLELLNANRIYKVFRNAISQTVFTEAKQTNLLSEISVSVGSYLSLGANLKLPITEYR